MQQQDGDRLTTLPDDVIQRCMPKDITHVRRVCCTFHRVSTRAVRSMFKTRTFTEEWRDALEAFASMARRGLLVGVTSLYLYRNRIGSHELAEHLPTLAEALSRLPSLTYLDLRNNSIGPDALGSLALDALIKLRCLKLGNNPLLDKGAAALATSLAGPLKRLTNLDISNICIDEAGLLALAPALAGLVDLVHLDMQGIMPPVDAEGAKALGAALACLVDLRSLNMESTCSEDAARVLAEDGLRRMTNLTRLEFDHNHADAGCLQALGTMTQLVHLGIKTARLKNLEAVGALRQLTRLTHLSASYSMIDADGTRMLVTSRCLENVQVLHLNSNWWRSDGARALASDPTALRNLKVLNLSGNAIGDADARELFVLTSLVSLDLGHNAIVGNGLRGISSMALLKVLKLDCNDIDDVGIDVLADEVVRMPNMQRLCLIWNKFSRKAAIALQCRVQSMHAFSVDTEAPGQYSG